jgi:16S rRNA (guanine(966)-N(2))-methyltransferase RsmD
LIITGGEARGRRIASPEGMSVRPTASKIRQAIFNILGARVAGAHFLDIFAGSGLMGIEALSRGAELLVAIDENRKLTRAIEKNLVKLGYQATVIGGEFRQVLPKLQPASFDIIFADPPYKSPFVGSLLQSLDRRNLLKPDGLLAIEHAKGLKFPEGLENFRLLETRTYGHTGVSFFDAGNNT